MQLRGTYSPSNTNYSTGREGVLTHNFGGMFNAQLTLPKAWSIGSDMRYEGMSGYSNGYNRNQTIWNAEISKRFLKSKAATLRLRVTDILQQRKNIVRNTSSDYFEDVKYNTLGSYFMLTFAYRFNSMGNRGGGSRSGGGDGFGGGERGGFGGGEQRGGFGGGERGGMRMMEGGF